MDPQCKYKWILGCLQTQFVCLRTKLLCLWTKLVWLRTKLLCLWTKSVCLSTQLVCLRTKLLCLWTKLNCLWTKFGCLWTKLFCLWTNWFVLEWPLLASSLSSGFLRDVTGGKHLPRKMCAHRYSLVWRVSTSSRSRQYNIFSTPVQSGLEGQYTL